MKKKLIGLLLCFSAVLAAFLGSSDMETEVPMSSIMLTAADADEICAHRQPMSKDPILRLSFNGNELFHDDETGSYLYSVPEEDANAFSPQVSAILNTPAKIGFTGESIDAEMIRENRPLHLIIYTDTEYFDADVFCTTLPIISIYTKRSILDAPVKMKFVLFDNRAKAPIRHMIQNGSIHVRGSEYNRYYFPKDSYRFSLNMSDEEQHAYPLLGLRADDDWILYSPYEDPEKIRNVFSSQLWFNSCGFHNSFDMANGNEYRYVEAFINGKYRGLYALGYPIDDKSLALDYSKGEHSYKINAWVSADFVNSLLPDGSVEHFELHQNIIPGGDDPWNPLKDYLRLILKNTGGRQALFDAIDYENSIDLFLFLNLIQAVDHSGFASRKSFYNLYLTAKNAGNHHEIVYTPWDMDKTWGEGRDIDKPYDIDVHENVIFRGCALYNLIEMNDKEIISALTERYHELRLSAWSDEAILDILDQFEADIYGSGAFHREMLRWPDGYFNDPEEGLSAFKTYVLERLSIVDKQFSY